MKKKRILSIFIFAAVIATMIVITVLMMKPVSELAGDPEKLRDAVKSSGITTVLYFDALLILQVFAAIVPGGPFEIAAGYAFGIIPGALICDIGMSIGGILVFLLSRKFGIRFIELFFTKEEIENIKILKTTKDSRFMIFLIFLIPGTPKDILSYLLGLTDLPLKEWIFINFVGRLPAILLSSLSGNALADEKYGVFIVVVTVIVVLTGFGALWYKKRNKK